MSTAKSGRRVGRWASAAAAGAFAGALVGCSGEQASQVSILNESRTGLRFAAWPAESPIPDRAGDGRTAALTDFFPDRVAARDPGIRD